MLSQTLFHLSSFKSRILMKSKITVMLVEDNPEYREGIAIAMEGVPDITLTRPFGTAEIALRTLQNAPEHDQPDLVLLDLNLPGLSGIDALPWFKKYSPQTPVIILTQSNREADVLAAIGAGAAGYLLKSATRDQIIEAIRLVKTGDAAIDPHVARYILKTLRDKPQKAEKDCCLSEREIDVLTLLGDGLVKKEIAERLHISAHTVDNHIRHIYEKLNVPNAPAAISKAYKSGLFPPGT
jgi:DNA-binding NarL/FixJ family response regulator